MKKRVLVWILGIVLIIGMIISFLLTPSKESIITIDINPSIEIHLNKKEIVKKVIPLNSDAKEIVPTHYKGKELKEVFQGIVQNLIDKDRIEEKELTTILLYSKGKISKELVQESLNQVLNQKNVDHNIILIDQITKEDKTLAKKYHITPAKASYIRSIQKEYDNIDIKKLIQKSANDLNETKNSGKYCNDGYILEGDWCLKEINRKEASPGKVCPKNYFDYNGICYYEEPFYETENLKCPEEFTLENENCIRRISENPSPKYHCQVGELIKKGDLFAQYREDNETMVCVDKSTGEAPKLRCLYNSGHIMIDGKCYNGPAPLIGGGCPNGDLPINGGCYSLDDEDQWQCPDGNIYHRSQNSVPDICPDTMTYYEPTIEGYSCPKGFQLENNVCIKVEEIEVQKERLCPESFTMIESDRCIQLTNQIDHEDGFVCEEENSKVKGNICVIYEIVEAYNSH